MIKNRKADSNVSWPTFSLIQGQEETLKTRQTDRTATLHSSNPSTAEFCFRHELFRAGGLRCKSGTGELSFDMGAHCCFFRTRVLLTGDGGGMSVRSVPSQHEPLPEIPLYVAYSLQLS